MYIIQDDNKNFKFSNDEKLYDKIEYNRIVDMIKNSKIKVINFSRGNNNYGNWRFITLYDGKKFLVLYGHGNHNFTESQYSNTWFICDFTTLTQFQTGKIYNKKTVLSELNQEHVNYQDSKPTKKGRIFSSLAEMADEDAAYSMIQDIDS